MIQVGIQKIKYKYVLRLELKVYINIYNNICIVHKIELVYLRPADLDLSLHTNFFKFFFKLSNVPFFLIPIYG